MGQLNRNSSRPGVKDDNFAVFARTPTLGATAFTPKGLKVPCSAAELPARTQYSHARPGATYNGRRGRRATGEASARCQVQ